MTQHLKWRGLLLVLGSSLAVSTPVRALQLPALWRSVPDRPGSTADSSVTFMRMPPGWHITMGPAGLLYQPRYLAEGTYALESEIFHFANSGAAEYGFFVGGSGLESSESRYVSFVLRGDGAVSAWEKSGSGIRPLVEWRRSEAVLANANHGDEPVRNLLRLVVSKHEVVLKANGLDVLVLPRDSLHLDGNFGFRVGQRVNLHVTTLNLTSRLAPTPD